jgi:Calx-beta domain
MWGSKVGWKRVALAATVTVGLAGIGTAGGSIIAHSAPAAKPTCAAAGTTYTHIRMSPQPIATAGSLQSGQSVPFSAEAMVGSQCVPDATMWLVELSHVTGDTMTVSPAQCSGQTTIGTTPVECTADANGKVQITYTVPTVIPDSGVLELADANSITNPSIYVIQWYLYEMIFQFSTSPIAPNGSLAAGQTVNETMQALGVGGTPEVGFTVDLSLTSTAAQPGSVMVGTTPLTSTPQAFVTDSSGNIQMTYTAPATPGVTGIDTIAAQSSLAASPAVTATTSYDFATTDPVISVGDEAQTEADQHPQVIADFDVTLSAPQAQPVSVQYITVCGIGDKTCKEDYLQSLKPKTVTFPAGVTSLEIPVTVYSYPAPEPYNEGYFIQLLKPTAGVLGRSMAQGTLLGDDETTTAPILYIGDVSVVCGASGNQVAEFAVVLSSPQSGAVTFSYATQDGSAVSGTDYTGISGTATIPAGQTSIHLPVTILPNAVATSTRTFVLNITSPSGATIERATGVGTVLNWTAQ